MKRAILVFAFALALTATAIAQTTQPASVKTSAGAPSPEQLIRIFAAKEAEFRTALNEYSFKREAIIQTIGMGGQITGEYKRVSRFVFDDKGNRFEKILHMPVSTLTEITISPEDLEDLGGVQAFALEISQIDKYNLTYVGQEHIDELDLHIFDVAPKVMPNPKKTKERLFQGRVWVDILDNQIVKARGKGVPETKDNKFPIFETYREHIDGRYWFPTYAYSDDELVFDSGQVVRLRMRIKYTDFEKLKGTLRVIEEGEPGVEAPKDEPETTESGAPIVKPAPKPAADAPKPKP